MKYFFCLLTFLALLSGCSSDQPDVSEIAMEVQIRRLDREFPKLTTKQAVADFLDGNKLFAEEFLQRSQYPNDSILILNMHRMATDHHLDTLYMETEQVFGNMDNIRGEFEQAFRHVKYYYPNFKAPVIYTLVSGFGTDLYVSDSLIVIGLDYFLGDKGTYRPNNVPQYMLRRFRPEYIVPSTMNLLSRSYNKANPTDQTLLADMISWGKTFEFTKEMIPDAPDSLIIGYTGQQLTDAENNQDLVWAHFIEKKLFYETKNSVKVKYINERPYTAEIGEKCPGSIGRWLGWKLIREYRSHHDDVTLPQLMTNANARQIFEQSEYKGQAR